MTQGESSEIEAQLSRFLDLADQMISKDEFLFPYLWAQRQYRADQYQMASAAQLEDLFFDTLGTYVLQYGSGETFNRRQGREPWDYAFAGVALSHKEGIKPGLTAVWQPGEGPGNKTRLFETWNFEHPVVFVYMPKSVPCKWSASIPLSRGGTMQRTGTCWPLGHDALNATSAEGAIAFLGSLHGSSLNVAKAWPVAEWRDLSMHQLRQELGQPPTKGLDYWLDRTTQSGGLAGVPLAEISFPAQLNLESEPLLPGLYLLLPEELSAQQLESNNKAHYLPAKAVIPCMESARDHGRYLSMPMWPMEFADVTPPNLYAQQRRRYDEFMSARGSLN